MKAKKLLFLVMAICLANGVKAQFYDSADDIYYYVEEYSESEETKSIQDSYYNPILGQRFYLPTFTTERTGKILKEETKESNKGVLIFNFDGKRAVELTNSGWKGFGISHIKATLQNSSSYYEDKVETADYDLIYSSSSFKDIVRGSTSEWKAHSTSSSWTVYKRNSKAFIFSPDRNTLILHDPSEPSIFYYKRVDKSYFKVGRSRTPNSTMYE